MELVNIYMYQNTLQYCSRHTVTPRHGIVHQEKRILIKNVGEDLMSAGAGYLSVNDMQRDVTVGRPRRATCSVFASPINSEHH